MVCLLAGRAPIGAHGGTGMRAIQTTSMYGYEKANVTWSAGFWASDDGLGKSDPKHARCYDLQRFLFLQKIPILLGPDASMMIWLAEFSGIYIC